MSALIKSAFRWTFHHAGGLHAFRHIKRRSLRILTYHRFSDEGRPRTDTWEEQCRHLSRHFHVIPLSAVTRWLREGTPLPDKALVITVDDGYRDFYTVAYPVLRHYNLPATVFLATDFVDGASWLWAPAVRYLFRDTPLTEFRYIFEDTPPASLSLTTPKERRAAGSIVVERLKKLPNAQRLAFVSGLPQDLKVTLPPQPEEHDRPLLWDEVRRMARDGVEFGAHSKTHPILPNLETDAEIHFELSASKQRLEQELDRPAIHFCYPNGDWDERCVAAARACDFHTAVTTAPALILKPEDPLLLHRISVDSNYPELYFRELAAGFRL